MGAFERIKSGIPSMDRILDNIRLGDNVVMQVSALEDFKKMAGAFVAQAVKDNRKISYIRFAKHEPLLERQVGLTFYELNANSGFESFTVEVHKIIEKEGNDAFYVFDCLSDLQVTWSTDLMMGNFFCVTCPYLFKLDTVAWFPVLRGHHNFATIARIQETTQLLLDLYSDKENIYLHPIKVWNRYSSEMYLPHKLSQEDEFESLTSSVDLSDYYRILQQQHSNDEELNMDSYDRFFQDARRSFYKGSITEWTLNKISRSMMTHDLKMASMIKKEFSPEDFFMVKERLIGTGTIGGKACGMLLARKMVENYLPEYAKYLEPHDSYYIGTDVFYSYIVENGLWEMRIKQRDEDFYFQEAENLGQSLLKAAFPEPIRAQFRRMLEYFGQIPIIVRSSSFLEDGFGNAFAGKYESVFCPNGGTPQERLEYFENAVRHVYASTMNPSALEYRRKRGMQQADEQMAILVQRVSGNRFNDYYMPCIAGVGFSYSLYRWSEELSPQAGLLRLVAGLGTKAVDRTGSDYPRLVNLDKPESTTLVKERDKHRFSQHRIELIDISGNEKMEMEADDLFKKLPLWYTELIAEHDFSAERLLRERGEYREVRYVSCHGAVKRKELMAMLKKILETLQEHYENPVDTEFTINFREDGEYIVNLLQCRPLQVWQAADSLEIPEIRDDEILFQTQDLFMGNLAKTAVDVVVWIDSKGYHECPYNQKTIFAHIVGQISRYYKERGKKIMLISPGRLGTSSPDLGLAVSFSDISNFNILCEYADPDIGFIPELSFGSHMFQDLVESDMFYVALIDAASEGNFIFNKNFWKNQKSILTEIVPDQIEFSDVIKVYEPKSEDALSLYADHKNRRVICGKFDKT